MQHQIERVIDYIVYNMQTDSESFTLILATIVVTVILVSFSAYRAITDRQIALVKETSERYKALLKLNSEYSFFDGLKPEYYEYFRVNSKTKFDRFNFNSNMKTRIQKDRETYLELLAMIYSNRDDYKKYQHDLNKLPELSVEFEHRMSIRRYQKLEEKVCNKIILHPTTDVVFYGDLRYTSTKGRNSYHTQMRYLPHHIQGLLVEMKKEEKFKESKAYQRSKMSDSLRYDIMKRDGFRCVLCGRTAKDGIQLHVDHIKPIAKGGKTVPSNLRTLCDQCNLGKSDKWDEYGYN